MMGALTWAINAVYVRRIISGYRAFQVVLYPMCVWVPAFFLGAIWLDPVMVGRIDAPVIGALAYQSLLTASAAGILVIHAPNNGNRKQPFDDTRGAPAPVIDPYRPRW